MESALRPQERDAEPRKARGAIHYAEPNEHEIMNQIQLPINEIARSEFHAKQ